MKFNKRDSEVIKILCQAFSGKHSSYPKTMDKVCLICFLLSIPLPFSNVGNYPELSCTNIELYSFSLCFSIKLSAKFSAGCVLLSDCSFFAFLISKCYVMS